jgi:hypothetical protein
MYAYYNLFSTSLQFRIPFLMALCARLGFAVPSIYSRTVHKCHNESLKLPPTCKPFPFCRNRKEYFVLVLFLSLFDSQDGWMQRHITILWTRHWVIKFRYGLLPFMILRNVLETRADTVFSVAFEFLTANRPPSIVMEWVYWWNVHMCRDRAGWFSGDARLSFERLWARM